MGVNYTPTNIGNVEAGGPAFEYNLGDSQIVSVNGEDVRTRYFPFEHLMEAAVLSNGKPIKLGVIREGETTPTEVTLSPSFDVRPEANMALLGGSPAYTNKVGIKPEELQACGQASVAIEAKDVITAVDGQPVTSGMELIEKLVQASDKSVEFTIERSGDDEQTQTLTSVVPPNMLMDTGVVLQIGQVVAVQIDSPAFGKIQAADRIVAMDGQPIGDPFTLSQRLIELARAGESIELRVKRVVEGQSSEVDVELQPRLPRFSSHLASRDRMAFDSLGIAIELTRIVESVRPGSPAAQAGFQSGDEIVGMQFQLTDEQQKDEQYKILRNYLDFEHPKLKKRTYIGEAMLLALQQFREPIPVDFSIRRGNDNQTLTLKPIESDSIYWQIRGLTLELENDVYVSNDLWESFNLGLRRTGADMLKVVGFLGKLIKGDIAVTNLGGPGTIAAVATMEASQGTTRLLMFLTLLSANLAIVNFLPIPVLDGGHMVFLAYEAIFRRPVNLRMQEYLTYAGLLFILGLMVFVIGLDITRFSGL